MASSGRYSDGTLLRAPKGNLAIVAGGKLRAVQDRRLLEDEDFTPTDPVDVEQAEFDSLPQAAPLTAPNWTWDTGLVGVRPGETGHVASSRGRLTVATGHIVGENRAVAYTLLGGFHVSFSVIVHDAEGFPLPSSIGMPIQRIGVDGRWIGVNDRTVPWQYQMTPADASKVAQVRPVITWDPDSFHTILDNWARAGKSIGEFLGGISGVARLFSARKTS